MTMEPSIVNIIIAALPILVVLVLMLGFRLGAIKAGPAGWLVSLLVAGLLFGAGTKLLWQAQLRAALLAVYVLYIIWAALLFYHLVSEAGAIDAIGRGLSSLTTDRVLVALLLGWGFGSFLQGASGFGVPAAVVAPLLVGFGFTAIQAVVIALVGHAWAVTFGSLASSFLALIAATGRSGTELAPWSAFMLAIAGYGCGAIVLWVAGGWQALRRRVGYLMLFGTAMGLVQYALAQFGFYTIASFLAGLVGLGIMLFTFRRAGGESKIPAWSLLPYVLLVAIVLLGQSILKPVLDFMVLNLSFDRMETAKGWLVPAGSGRSINLFGHGGALLLYTILITTAIYLIQKRLDSGSIVRILKGTWKRGIRTTIGIFTMVAMAVVMDNAGMTQLIAEGMSQGVGRAFPAIAPWIGALGAFMTGSNTNSNVVFASMQQQTAVLLGMSPAIILAAQTTGGAIGALFAPAKVIVGCSTVDLEGEEAGVFRLALLYGGVILLSITVLTVLAVWLS